MSTMTWPRSVAAIGSCTTDRSRFTDGEVAEVRWVTFPELDDDARDAPFLPDGIALLLPLLTAV